MPTTWTADEPTVRRAIALAQQHLRVHARLWPSNTDREEMESAALEGARKALETYDPGRGCSFDSWARRKIAWEVAEARRQYGKSRSPAFRAFHSHVLSIESGDGPDGQPSPASPEVLADRSLPTMEELMERHESARRVRMAVEALPPNQRRVIWERVWEERSLPEVAASMGKTRRRILQIQREALQSLRVALAERTH